MVVRHPSAENNRNDGGSSFLTADYDVMTRYTSSSPVDSLYLNFSDSVVMTTSPGDEPQLLIGSIMNILVPILYGLVSVVGVAGNSLVIYVILSRERMRTVTNLLLLNLAVADLSFVLVIPPVTAYVITTPYGWPLGDAECRLMHYLVNVTAYVTVYTMVLISVIRYMTVVHSVKTVAWRTAANVVRAIVAVWFVMLLVNSPVLVSYHTKPADQQSSPLAPASEDGEGEGEGRWEEKGRGGVESEAHNIGGGDDAVGKGDVTGGDAGGGGLEGVARDGADMECQINSPDVGRALFATFFAFGYVLPLSVIACFSLGILRHITRHKAPVDSHPIPVHAELSGTGTSPRLSGGGGHTGGGRMANKKRQAGRMLIVVVVVFALLWLPVHVHLLVEHFVALPELPLYDSISPLWNCLAYFNSCVNPIIYNHTSKEFRDAFRDVACACGFACRRPSGENANEVRGGSGRGRGVGGGKRSKKVGIEAERTTAGPRSGRGSRAGHRADATTTAVTGMTSLATNNTMMLHTIPPSTSEANNKDFTATTAGDTEPFIAADCHAV